MRGGVRSVAAGAVGCIGGGRDAVEGGMVVVGVCLKSSPDAGI